MLLGTISLLLFACLLFGITPMGMAERAPHPAAALLFYDFMLSEGQQVMLGRQFMPASRKIPTLVSSGRIAVDFVPPDLVLDQGAKWQKLYTEILRGGSK